MLGKTILQVVVAVVMVIIGFLDDSVLNTVEILNAAIVGANAITIYVVPNLRSGVGKVAKMVASMMAAGATVLVTAVLGGVDMSEWLMVLVAVLGAAGIYAPPAPQHGITGSTVRSA